MNIPQGLVDAIKGWQLTNAALLFVAGHRPLAFVVGQGLYLIAPVAELLGAEHVDALAQLLSREDGVEQLESALRKG